MEESLSLSLDNLFAFVVIIMAAFAVPREHQRRVLIFGIITSLALRAVFIALGATLLSLLSFMFLVFVKQPPALKLTGGKYSEVLWKGTPKPGVAIAGGYVGGGVTGPGFCRSAVAGPRCGGPRGWRSRAGTGRVPRRTGAFRRGGRIRRGRRSGR